MNIPLTLGDYNGRTGAANAMELINMMSEPDQQGGTASFFLTGTPGLLEFKDLGYAAEGRGGYMYPNHLLAVVGKRLYVVEIDTCDSFEVGTLETVRGAIQFAENPTQIMIADNLNGYIFTKSTKVFAKITDADFPTPKAITWKDGYGVVVEDGSGKIYVSGINDFTSWDALDFVTAEYEPDNLVGVISALDSLWACGTKTTQVYYNSGNIAFPFDNRQGANMTIGCGATNSMAEGQNVVFWLDENGQVRMMEGYTPRIISTPGIDYRISNLSTFSDARGFFYTQEGHSFYCLFFPTDDLFLFFDIVTQQWHKRTSGLGRYRAAWIAQDGNTVMAGDYTNGKIYKLDPDTYTDNLLPIRWFFTLQAIHSDSKMVQHQLIEFEIESGVGTAAGEDPQLWIQYSDDDGGNMEPRTMAKYGENWRKKNPC